MAIYVCSDIHGCLDRFERLLDTLALSNSDHLYILGDVIDRNDGGIEILKKLMCMPNITLLMGNHESFMYTYLSHLFVLDKLDIKDDFPNNIWLAPNNGGTITLEKFSQEPLEIKKQILEYLSTLDLIQLINVENVNYHLSHAGTINNVLDKQTWNLKDLNKYQRESIVWDNPYRYDSYIRFNDYPENYVSIFGHVPVQKVTNDITSYNIYKKLNTINIDSGCAYKTIEEQGVHTALSCLCLNDLQEIYIV